jgi:hypothetical protein
VDILTGSLTAANIGAHVVRIGRERLRLRCLPGPLTVRGPQPIRARYRKACAIAYAPFSAFPHNATNKESMDQWRQVYEEAQDRHLAQVIRQALAGIAVRPGSTAPR